LRLLAPPHLEHSARDLALLAKFADLCPGRISSSIRRTEHAAPLGASRPMVVASRPHEEPGETAGKPAEGDPRLDEVKENTSLGIPARRNVTRGGYQSSGMSPGHVGK